MSTPLTPMPIINYKQNHWGCVIKKIIFVYLILTAGFLYAENDSFTTDVLFHGFPWGSSLREFTARMGQPVHTDEFNGFQSLVYDNLIVSGYPAFMVVYFSKNGLEGGTYYFHTFSLDELMNCYRELQAELLEKYGPTPLRDYIIREMRPYESVWNLENGYIYLNVNTRRHEPVSLWYSSPALTRILFGS